MKTALKHNFLFKSKWICYYQYYNSWTSNLGNIKSVGADSGPWASFSSSWRCGNKVEITLASHHLVSKSNIYGYNKKNVAKHLEAAFWENEYLAPCQREGSQHCPGNPHRAHTAPPRDRGSLGERNDRRQREGGRGGSWHDKGWRAVGRGRQLDTEEVIDFEHWTLTSLHLHDKCKPQGSITFQCSPLSSTQVKLLRLPQESQPGAHFPFRKFSWLM